MKNQVKSFLKDNSENFTLSKPVFYNSKFGLRFDLHNGDIYNDEYFNEVIERASTIFESTFSLDDKILLVYIDYKHKRRKIRFHNYIFRQIKNLKRKEIIYSKRNQNGVSDNIALADITLDRINYKNIFRVIANIDFDREPKLDKYGSLTGKEIYFINVDKGLAFHMYDDRGLDIVSSNSENLKPIFTKHNKWILDYDRSKIEKQFK
jgi:hypothetical protein